MTFKPMTKAQYPSRLWALVGFPESGKSTFATQMRAPLLPIDADHRFDEVLHLVEGDVFQLSDNPTDMVSPDTIAQRLYENMPGASIKTIVVDSLTAIIAPLITQAMADNKAGRNKSKIAGFVDKAMAMRQIQDAVTRWGVDSLWIYHLQKGRDNKAQKVVSTTIPKTEVKRLRRSINAELHVVQDGEKRGIKVTWSRSGASGMTLWDEAGNWQGMPEKLEAAMYPADAQPEKKKQAAEQTQAQANGTRPYTPDRLKERLGEIAAQAESALPIHRQRLPGILTMCFAGDDNAAGKRMDLLRWLVNADTVEELDSKVVAALTTWLNATDDGGTWMPSAMATQEAQAVWKHQGAEK